MFRTYLAAHRLLVVTLLLCAGCDRGAPDVSPSPSGSHPPAGSEVAPARRVPASKPARVLIETKAMGTLVRVVAYSNDKVDEAGTRKAIAHGFDEIRRLEQVMSPWRKESDLAQINSHAGKRVKVSVDTYRVIEKSLWASKISSGAFDITFASMSDVWKFGRTAEAEPRVPTKKRVAERRALVDWTKIDVESDTRQVGIGKQQRMGLGGIAKGYAVDRAADVLRSKGVRDFMFQAGGDLYVSGKKPNGERWATGIQDPRGREDTPFARLDLENCALSTAGDYERYYVVDKKRYHHIIDPRTGYPATASRSVSIWAPSSFVADAVDDAVFILGPGKGLEIVEGLEGVGAVIVDQSNKVWVSKRLKGRVKMLREPTP